MDTTHTLYHPGTDHTLPPGFYRYVESGFNHWQRAYGIAVPEVLGIDEYGNTHAVLCCDGIVGKMPDGTPRNGMSEVNRFNWLAGIDPTDANLSKQRPSALVFYALPQFRLFDKVTFWNLKGGMCKPHKLRQDDLLYFLPLLAEITEAYGIDVWHFAGLSGGANAGRVLCAYFKFRTLLLIANAHMGTEPTPISGTGLITINGEDDTIFTGQGIHGDWGEWLLSQFLITRHARRHADPVNQTQDFCQANGLSTTVSPRCVETKFLRCWTWQEQPVPIIRVVVKRPYGGHNVPGRNTGDRYESPASYKQRKDGTEVWPHGKPAPRDVFSAVEFFAAQTGLDRLKKPPMQIIRRSAKPIAY